jgi:glutathione S-transferase
MKLFDAGKAPNPRRVRIFFAEKQVALPEIVPLDLAKAEQKSAEFAKLNPLLQAPVLILDDGTPLAESMAICRYIEALHPEPALFGADAKTQGVIEMWSRRLEFGLYLAIQAVYRHGHPGMATSEIPQIADWVDANRPRVFENLAVLDRQLAQNRFVCGAAFSVADITGGVSIDFMRWARLAVPDDLVNIRRWHAELMARPSWQA